MTDLQMIFESINIPKVRDKQKGIKQNKRIVIQRQLFLAFKKMTFFLPVDSFVFYLYADNHGNKFMYVLN